MKMIARLVAIHRILCQNHDEVRAIKELHGTLPLKQVHLIRLNAGYDSAKLFGILPDMRQYGCGQRGLCPEIQVVDIKPGPLSFSSVFDQTVPCVPKTDLRADLFVVSGITKIIDREPTIRLPIGPFGEDIERSKNVSFQCQRDIFCLRLVLAPEFILNEKGPYTILNSKPANTKLRERELCKGDRLYVQKTSHLI